MDLIHRLLAFVSPPPPPEEEPLPIPAEYPMRPRSEIFQEHFGISDPDKSFEIRRKIGNSNPDLPLSRLSNLTVPYEAPSHPRLPSLEEIVTALEKNSLHFRGSARRVCKFGNMIVKMSFETRLIQEAEDMLWIQENSNVRVAKVYALTVEEVNHRPMYCLFLEYMPGEPLDVDKWLALNQTQRESIIVKFSEQVKLLRAIPSEGYYGRINGQGYHPVSQLVGTNGKDVCGPYQTYEDFLSAIYTTAEIGAASGPQNYEKADVENYSYEQRRALHELKDILGNGTGSEPKFTHVDLNFQNWLVEPLDGTLLSASEYKVSIIDWCGCGWFPAWAQMFSVEQYMNDFLTKYITRPGTIDILKIIDDEGPKFLAMLQPHLGEPRYGDAMDVLLRLGLHCQFSLY